jgi:protocatechuate 3,4-dioxygenase beta subunit
MTRKTMGRREALLTFTAAGAALAVACGGDSTTSASDATTSGTTETGSTNSSCAVTPTETIGPYPSTRDLVRSDVRDGKEGVPLELTVRVVNASNGCSPLPGHNVEIWHVDAAGNYSQYGSQASANFLRGILTTNAAGEVTFTTIYPGWYQGRATHIHLEVTQNGVSRRVTQIAFPESVNDEVHRSGVYAARGANPITNLRDGIFADSLASEIVTPMGSPATGYTALFQVAIAA